MQKDANEIPPYLLEITVMGSYIYDVHTEGGGVARCLEIYHVFADSVAFTK